MPPAPRRKAANAWRFTHNGYLFLLQKNFIKYGIMEWDNIISGYDLSRWKVESKPEALLDSAAGVYLPEERHSIIPVNCNPVN
jgi:hypothetical protein